MISKQVFSTKTRGNWNEYIKVNGLFNADKVILVMNSSDITDMPDRLENMPDLNRPTTNPPSALWELLNRYVMLRIQKFAKAIAPIKQDQTTTDETLAITKGSAILNQTIDLIEKSGAELNAVQFWGREESHPPPIVKCEMESAIPPPQAEHNAPFICCPKLNLNVIDDR